MKKKYLHLTIFLMVIILLSNGVFALTLKRTEDDGTEYTIKVDYHSRRFKKDELFEVNVALTADTFGTNGVTIIAFYDIQVYVALSGETYLNEQNTTLPDIETEGATESASFAFNVSDIEDEFFMLGVTTYFDGNNSEGNDVEDYGIIWVVARVSEANIAIVAPIIAIISVAYLVKKKRKK